MSGFDAIQFGRRALLATVLGIAVSPRGALAMQLSEGRPLHRPPCDSLHWRSPAQVIPSVGDARVARFPVIASDSTRAIVVGNNIMFYDHRPVPSRTLTVLDVDAGERGAPRGDFVFAFPRGVMRHGTLYLLWAEPDREARTRDAYAWPGRLTSVWSATWNAAMGWSAPERIFTGAFAASGDATPSVSAAADASLLPFGKTQDSLGVSILAFRLVGSRWETVKIPAGEGAYSPSVVERNGIITAAFADAADGSTFDDNSVFIRRSVDGGATWLPRQLLSRSGRHAAFDTQILSDRFGQLHLIWRRAMNDSVSTIGHMMSPDGRAWTNAEELTIPAPIYAARGAVDACGGIHVVFLNFHAGRAHPTLGYVVWRGTWRGLTEPFPQMETAGATVHAGLDYSVRLVMLTRTGRSSETNAFRMMHSRLVP